MAKKLKRNEFTKLKIDQNKGDVTCRNDKTMPLFSFAHTSDNKNYNFNFFGKRVRDEIDVRKQLDLLLRDLSATTWLDLGKRGNYQIGGFETLSYGDINVTPNNLTLPKDENILSFRFGPADAYRLLGCRKEGCQVLYVIGYDFNFSAYNHGS